MIIIILIAYLDLTIVSFFEGVFEIATLSNVGVEEATGFIYKKKHKF